MVEGARLESEYGSKAHRGFESLPLRQHLKHGYHCNLRRHDLPEGPDKCSCGSALALQILGKDASARVPRRLIDDCRAGAGAGLAGMRDEADVGLGREQRVDSPP